MHFLMTFHLVLVLLLLSNFLFTNSFSAFLSVMSDNSPNLHATGRNYEADHSKVEVQGWSSWLR